MICHVCGQESTIPFKFCPNCGQPRQIEASVVETPLNGQEGPALEPALGHPGTPGYRVDAGTIVFGLFAAISLIVSLFKGLTPIYLLEATGWAGLAWY
jgi:hypothetical protein